jgi:O-antigen/teichoic acid export membrane protein
VTPRAVRDPLTRGWRRLLAGRRNPIATNLVARLGAIASLTLASLLVARIAGPAGVGTLVLLRVLPWLLGLILGSGLYGATPYFLSGPGRTEPRYRTTIVAIAVAAGLTGAVIWMVASPLFGPRFFPQLSPLLLAVAGISVLTQALESTAMACSQGFDDLAGANRIIFLEEFLFVPIFGLLLVWTDPYTAMVVALPLGDLGSSVPGWVRLARRGYFTGVGRPSAILARRVAAYGFRAQLGTIALLLNARLDFAVVGALIGPASLGIYAVASRYAELLRLPALAMNYVLYPDYARDGGAVAAARARVMIPRIGWVPAAVAVPMALAAPLVLPLFFGQPFEAAVLPAWILLVGLAGGGVSGVISAFLSGVGRPGLYSAALAAGLPVTVLLDLLLIPPFGVPGAAAASAVAYLVTTGVLVACFRAVARSERATAGRAGAATESKEEVSK